MCLCVCMRESKPRPEGIKPKSIIAGGPWALGWHWANKDPSKSAVKAYLLFCDLQVWFNKLYRLSDSDEFPSDMATVPSQ